MPLLGVILRTKFLFTIPFINYKNVLSAHSHFAFGGWVTMMLMILFIDNLLPPAAAAKTKYQYVLWATQLSAAGMVVIFPFTGYGILAIIFSTLFIFATYAFTWIFARDFFKAEREKSVSLLGFTALACLIISSIGPFMLAYILATNTGNSVRYRDALYTYLHFQYNGFFSLGVLALFFHHIKNMVSEGVKKIMYTFSLLLAISVFPALFLSLTWHPGNQFIRVLAIIGTVFTLMALICFVLFIIRIKKIKVYSVRMAYIFWVFAMISFAIKLLLQMGTIFPELATIVFGFRPIIIGFLHLVFLGFVTFFLLAQLVEAGAFSHQWKMTKVSLLIFSGAIIINETVLLIQGAGLMMSVTHMIFSWLLWGASMLLFVGSLLILLARFR